MPDAVPREPSAQTQPPAAMPAARLLSLDALRGFDMFWIMGADSLGGAAATLAAGVGGKLDPESPVGRLADQLEHVPWEGLHFYDLIFPTFVFMAGVSAVFSLTKLADQHGKAAALARLFRRALLMYVIGIFYYGGFNGTFDHIRPLGVLQRIALAYLGAGALFLGFKPKALAGITAAILLGYWALVALTPVRDITITKEAMAKRMAETGEKDPKALFYATTATVRGSYDEGRNVVNHFDFQYLPGRKWDGYYDPEGILSTLPAVGTCLLGVFAGLWLRRTDKSPSAKAAGLAVGGVALLAGGLLWGTQFPIIKKLWTSSYVLAAAGWSTLALSAFYWIIDVRGWKRWCTPFVWVGLNPITVYLACNLVDFDALAARFVGGDIKEFLNHAVAPGFGVLTGSLLSVVFGILFAGFLHRRKIYLRL